MSMSKMPDSGDLGHGVLIGESREFLSSSR